jgi:hypothetical protein
MNKTMKKYGVRGLILGLVAAGMFLLAPVTADAHCDTMDGPAVKDAIRAMDTGNVKWVQPKYEAEVSRAFRMSMKVKDINADTKNLAEQYFFEILLRNHRAGEGVAFDGVKPHGWPVDERVKAADQSIALGNLEPLKGLVEPDKWPELQRRFQKVMSLKDFDVNRVEEGREYIEAYVQFFKFAEGEDEHHESHEHVEHHGHLAAE